MAYQSTAVVVEVPKTGIEEHAGHTITRYPNGEIEVSGPGMMRARIPAQGEFDENLAEFMDQGERKALAMRLVEFARVDEESREDWKTREKDALDMMGVTDIDNETNEELGHSITHPALMEATTRFQANGLVELFPPMGPCETKILGVQTQQKVERATRIRTFINHYLTDVDEGYFDDTDKMLMYLPMGGSAFRRAGQDYTTGLPILRYVTATNFIAPYAGTDLKSMPRYAWKFTMTGEDIDQAMEIGMFLDVTLPKPAPGSVEHSAAADASDSRTPQMHDRDTLYPMFEYHVDLRLDADAMGRGDPKRSSDDTGMRPYIVVLDAANEEVLMVRRNWRQKDNKRRKRIWFAHHKFLPGLGFYGWGYPHVIGSLGRAASGAVNSLLDSALAANFQGGFVSKEAKINGEFRMEHGVWKQVDSSAEDLARSFYTPPFKEPSPALFQLLGELVGAIQRFSGTTDAAVGDGNNNGPVGTTVALIEQASKPQNAIHKRLHVSFSAELKMLGELIEDFIGDRYDYQIGDESQYLLKQDFAPGVNIICVTDPAISSDTQRVMRAQAVLQLQQQAPTLYPPEHQAEAHRRMLVALKVPNVDAVGPKVKTPQYLDAVAENALIFQGMPVRVYPTQDDQAHLTLHQDGLQRAQALFPPDVFEKMIMPAMQAHIRDHMAKSYIKAMFLRVGIAPHFDQDGNPQGLSPQMENMITARVVQALPQMPHPQPKPGSPNAQQMQAQAEAQAAAAEAKQKLDQADQAFQAEERRKDIAFQNEQRRKDQAMLFQEGRITDASQADVVRKGAAADQTLQQNEAKHVQGLTQGAQEADEASRRAEEAHQAGLTQARELAAAKQGDEGSPTGEGGSGTPAAIQAGDKVAQAAAGMEANADAHTGVG